MTFLYIIAGAILWIAIGAITFRVMDWYMGDTRWWVNPGRFEDGREAHAKMAFWMGPIYTVTTILMFACFWIAEAVRYMRGVQMFRKIMGLDNG